MITIIDLGIGNIGSLENIFLRSKILTCRTNNADIIAQSAQIILPGVGAFDTGMQKIIDLGIGPAIDCALIEQRATMLGICLGMQMLCQSSEEGRLPGLGLIEARAKRLPITSNSELKVPHMGWNSVRVRDLDNPIFTDLGRLNRFYFVHSYGVICENPANVLGVTEYGGEFCSAIASDRVIGVQFHPEKSHRFGRRLLENYANML